LWFSTQTKKFKKSNPLAMLMYPKSVGTVRLASNSPWDHPIIDPQYLSHPDDLEVLAGACRLSYEIFEAKAFEEFTAGGRYGSIRVPNAAGVTQDEFGTNDYWREYARQYCLNVYHYSGTCKMGREDDAMAVLDERLRVRGVKNLRVADASVQPMIVGTNTCAVSHLAGEKCAQMITEEHRGGV
jgi:choline dehydrogenase-like flavoprotein